MFISDLIIILRELFFPDRRTGELKRRLWNAVLAGEIDQIPALAAAGAPIDSAYQSNEPDSPIVYAARQGNIGMVEALLSAGASINSRGMSLVTPLMVAAGWGHANLVDYLLRHGAEVFLRDEYKRTVYDHARLQKDPRKRARVLAILNEHVPQPPDKERDCDGSDMISVILIIESDSWLQRALERFLRKHKYLVVTAADGKEGLVKASIHLPQLIITSIFQVGISGIEIAERLQKDQATRKIPVLLIHPKPTDQRAFDQALESAGIRYDILRPIDWPRLSPLVARILESARNEETET